MKVKKWDPAQAKKILKKRLEDCKVYRKNLEPSWLRSEGTVYNTGGIMDLEYSGSTAGVDLEAVISSMDADEGPSVGVNYAFKNYRFLHAQLSANPPSVIARPTSGDPSDKRSADAADRLIRHAIRAFDMQETIDQSSAATLLYGTGWMKTVWDENKGNIASFDEESGEVEMEGAIDIYAPSTWDVWIDPHAKVWKDVRFAFERKKMTFEEAEYLYPDYSDELKKAVKGQKSVDQSSIERYADAGKRTKLNETMIDIFYYYEKGLPVNGMAGRYVTHLEDGTILGDVKVSPCRYAPGPDEYPVAFLPFHVLTDIDVKDQVYGKSFVEYCAITQDIINRLDSLTLDNVQAHGVARMVLPEGCEIAEDSISENPVDVIKITGTQPPHFVSAPTIMPEVGGLRQTLMDGGDHVSGVNESMFGQQSREQSGFSMQYATNQGNMIRRRLFNKYVQFTESVYKQYISLVQKHWDVPQTVRVLGQEKAFEVMDIKGADVAGGFDLVIEYGASFSLDPTARREEIMQLMPVLKEAGMPVQQIMGMMKLNELQNIHDTMQLGSSRQTEIIEEMIIKGIYIEPQDWQQHDTYLAYMYTYMQTREFYDLEENIQQLIIQHKEAREQLAADAIAAGAPATAEAGQGGAAPGPSGMEGAAGPGPEGGPTANPQMTAAPMAE